MKTTKYESNQSRRILTAMIVHDEVLAKICDRVGEDEHPFNQRWLDLVGGWCFKFFKKYNKAPRGALRTIFERQSAKLGDEATVELIESFLAGLSRDYEGLKKETNEAFILDTASTHFQRVRLQRMAEQVEDALLAGDLEQAELCRAGYKPIDFSSTAPSDPFDEETIRRTFRRADLTETIVNWPGDADRFLSPHFRRGDFVAFCGPEKRGKSFWILETVWRAIRQRRKVLYYVFGDMPEHEVYQRLYTRVLRCPFKREEVSVPRGEIEIVKGKTGPVLKFSATLKRLEGYRVADVLAAKDKLNQIMASGQVNLKVIVRGGYELSASGIEHQVKELALRDGWVPDLVAIDYADLLDSESESKRQEVRHQINLSWSILRRIALDPHCLVVTATQASAKSYVDRWVIQKGDFSEDKRKNAHVTGMLGINQTPVEKLDGIYRLNWVVQRSAKWTSNQVLWTVGNLALACPCIISKIDLKGR